MNNNAINASYISVWMSQKLSPEAVKDSLLAGGHNETNILEYLAEYRKRRREKKQFFGFALMFIGGFLGFLACILTLFNVVPDLHDVFLFGLTSVAIIVAFYGLYIVFES